MASITDVGKGRDGINGQNETHMRPLNSVDAEIQALNEQIDNAHTLTDVRTVIERLKCWVAANTQYRERTYPVFEQLYRREEGLKEAVVEAERMGLSATEQEQRQRLSQLRLCVRATQQALTEWRSVHPDDPIVVVINDHLQIEEEIASQLYGYSDTTA